MQKLLKKVLSAALILTMILSLAACGKAETKETGEETKVTEGAKTNETVATQAPESEPDDGDTAEVTTPAEPDYSEHMTFSIASVQVNESTDYNGDDFTKWWCEKYNFDWDVISVSLDNWGEKVRTWISSEDLPDITIFDYRHGEMMNYINQELVYRFPDGWEERWPNVAAANRLSGIGAQVAEEVGGTYFLARPNYAENKPTEKDLTNMIIYLRKDWAEAVGFELKDAYTINEIMDYARLIKEKDPGNVGDKLIPIGANSGNCRNIFVSDNSTYSGDEAFYYGDDGDFHWGHADEATGEGLKLWKQAYEEGLLHPEFYTYSGSEDVEDFYIAGVSGLMWYQGNARYMQMVENNFKENLGLEYDDAVWTCYITDNDGVYHDWPRTNFWGVILFRPDIETEKFERYMDMLDYSASAEGQLFIRMGFENIDWKYDESGNLVTLLEPGKEARSKYPSIYPIYHQLIVLSDDFGLISPNYKEKFRNRCIELYQLREKDSTDKSVVPMDWDTYFYSSDAKNSISFNYSEEYASLITSDKDIETAWKEWIANNAFLIDPVLQEMRENVQK